MSHRRIPGEEGIWVFVLADMIVFALFFATFMYSRAKNPGAFAHDHASLHVALGTANTILLLTSSLLVALGMQQVTSGITRGTPRFFGAALVCGLGFVVVKSVEWSQLLTSGKSINGGEFFTYYFMFTGIHLLHVVIGCVVLSRPLIAARRAELTRHQVMLCEAGGIFWHMVDLLWVMLFALFYLMR